MTIRSIPDPDGVIMELRGFARQTDDPKKQKLASDLIVQITRFKDGLESMIDRAESLMSSSKSIDRKLTVDELEAVGDYRTAQRLRETLAKRK